MKNVKITRVKNLTIYFARRWFRSYFAGLFKIFSDPPENLKF